MMRLTFLLLILSFLTSCSKKETQKIDGMEYAVSPVDSSANFLIERRHFTGLVFDEKQRPYTDVFTFRMLVRPTKEEKVTPFTPSLAKVIKAEKILKNCIEADRMGSDSMQIWNGAVKDLSFYNRQYFGVINQKGEKLIWINCFPKGDDSFHSKWKKEEVSVQDGGDSYFNIVTNLAKEHCYRFFRNSIGG